MRKLSLTLFFFFWIRKLAQLSTASQDWISLRGCYKYKNETGSIVPFNEPQSCFDRCPNSTAVGLKNSTCICYQSYTYRGLSRDNRCNLTCPGKPWLYCGAESGSNDLINVYSKGPPQTHDINENTDYGFVSVSISPSGTTYYVSKNDSTSRNGFICYDDIQVSDPCHRFDGNPTYTWEEASETCHHIGQVLIAFSNISSCLGHHLITGVFWIGLYKDGPGFTTSTSASSTSSKPTLNYNSVTPVIDQTPKVTTSTSASFTSSKPTLNYNSVTPVIDQTSKASSSDGINVVTVAVPVAVIFLTILLLTSILICKKKKLICFKERHKSVQTGEIDKALPTEILGMDPLIAVNVSSSGAPGSSRATLIGHPDNIRPIHSGQTYIQGSQYAGSNADNSDTDNHAELDRYTNDDHSVLNERTENPNVESRYDETIQSNRPTTASDVHAIVPLVQKKRTGTIHRSDEVQNELNANNSDSRKEETKKHKRSRKRKKRKNNTLFDVPADHPVVEGQTNINN